MSIKFVDDPSYYQTITQSWDNATDASVSSGNGRFGTASIRVSGGAGQFAQKGLGVNITEGVLAVSVKPNTIAQGGNSVPLIALMDAGVQQVDVRITAGGNLLVTRNGTQLVGTTVQNMVPGRWYRLEFYALIDATTGKIQVKVNGQDWIPLTSNLNTRNTANSQFNEIQLGTPLFILPQSFSYDFNDVVVTDNNTPNANFLGDKRVFLLMPNSDSSVQWTPNGAASNNGSVKEVPPSTAPDEDTTYVSDSTVGHVDLYGYQSLPSGARNINSVTVAPRGRKDDAGIRTIRAVLKSSTTQVESADFAMSTSYAYNQFIQETDPNGGGSWTASAVNAVLAGVKVIA